MVFSNVRTSKLDRSRKGTKKSADPDQVNFSNCHRQIQTILQIALLGQLITERFGIKITRANIANFEGSTWLTDVEVDFYLNLICEISANCFCYTPTFYLSLVNRFDSAVQSISRINLFVFDFVFIPICERDHWTLAVINNRERTIDYYDSLDRGDCPPIIRMFVEQGLRQHSREFEAEGWRVRTISDHPRQTNGSDCGVFLCQYAKHIAFNQQMLFRQVILDG